MDVCVQRVHNPVLAGPALILLPEGLLVRWPPRSAVPAIGAPFSGTAVHVPEGLREAVLTLLFGASALSRCDAAKRIAAVPSHRARILHRIYSKSYVVQLISASNWADESVRARLDNETPIRRVARARRNPEANCR